MAFLQDVNNPFGRDVFTGGEYEYHCLLGISSLRPSSFQGNLFFPYLTGLSPLLSN